MTTSLPPHPAPTSGSDAEETPKPDAEETSKSRGERGAVNPEQDLGAGATAAVGAAKGTVAEGTAAVGAVEGTATERTAVAPDGAPSQPSHPRAETEVIASGGGVLFDDAGSAQPSDDELAFEDDVSPRAALVRASDDAGARAATDEHWLRGTTPRRLRVIDRRLRIALTLQSVVVAVVLALWLLGKLSWNHDPITSQRFRPLELPALTNRAQNAALEFHHDLVTGEFGQARLLVAEEAEKLVDEAATTCQASAPCASKERVFTRATLMQSAGQDARAFVESFAADGRPVGDATYLLSHTSGRWLVTERVAQ